MSALEYAPRAVEDLERLAQFLALKNPRAAGQAIERIIGALELLASHPLIGHPAEGGLRQLVISRSKSGYVALYRYDARRDLVIVLGFRHQQEAGFL